MLLHIILCTYVTWSLALREEHRVRGFENKHLQRIFGTKMEKEQAEENYIMNG
jgi:hypothetical protein